MRGSMSPMLASPSIEWRCSFPCGILRDSAGIGWWRWRAWLRVGGPMNSMPWRLRCSRAGSRLTDCGQSWSPAGIPPPRMRCAVASPDALDFPRKRRQSPRRVERACPHRRCCARRLRSLPSICLTRRCWRRWTALLAPTKDRLIARLRSGGTRCKRCRSHAHAGQRRCNLTRAIERRKCAHRSHRSRIPRCATPLPSGCINSRARRIPSRPRRGRCATRFVLRFPTLRPRSRRGRCARTRW